MDTFRVEFSTSQAINFSYVFNGAWLIEELFIQNLSERDIFDVVIGVSCPQGLIKPCQYCLDILPKNLKIDVNTLNIEFDYNYLAALENIVQGEIVLSIQSRTRAVFAKNPIIILPYDYWTARISCELIASFVTPDNIDAKAILKTRLAI